jgi:hypothetical protein
MELQIVTQHSSYSIHFEHASRFALMKEKNIYQKPEL